MEDRHDWHYTFMDEEHAAQARKDLQGGGLNLNNQRQSDPQRGVTSDELLFGKHLLLRKGKRNYTVMTVN